MNYIGTRNAGIRATASQAILKGICEDGGLFVPQEIPRLEKSLEELSHFNYQQLAYEILKKYFTDFTEEELRDCINKAYDDKFDTPEIAPIVKKEDAMFLELFHGKTLAFKDMALSILPYLMKTAAKKNAVEKEIVILAATSGDTGKAALEGFADVEGTRIIVFFPEDGVSPVQKLQMTTQEGKNTCVVGIHGNFDDAQSAVKRIFTDEIFAKELGERGFLLSSANSINIGRLVPQIVYYFYAYFEAVRAEHIALGDKIHFTIPTGNFGNILAGYYAKCMGLPVGQLLCASNDNKVLYDFFQTGTYDKNREFHVTVSPSMDILISSNLERLLWKIGGEEKTRLWMESLKKSGVYHVGIKESSIIARYATKEETFDAIRSLYQKTGYVMDTHTAVAYAAYQKYKTETEDDTPMIIVSTASPYKFTKDVMMALDERYAEGDAFAFMDSLQEISGVKIPASIHGIQNREILHHHLCDKHKIKDFVKEYLISN